MGEELRYRRLAKWGIFFVAVVSTFMAYQVSQIGFDYDFERFFPQGDPETEYFFEFREKYGTENDFIMFGLENEAGIFDSLFLAEAKRLQEALSSLPYVTGVESIVSLNEPIREPLFGSFSERPYLRYQSPEHYSIDSLRIYSSPDLVNSFVSSKGESIALLLEHDQYLAKLKCDELAKSIEATLSDFHFDRVYLAGRATGQRYFVERMRLELMLFVSASILLITLFLIIAFRTVWGVVIPLIVVLLSIVWLVGWMHLSGKEIDLLLTILPTILFVVGMSDVVHILTKYLHELRAGLGKYEAIKVSLKEVGLATLLTSLTTAIGFLTLMTSSIAPIREFGLYTAIGVFIAFILAFTLLPATMILTKAPAVKNLTLNTDFWTNNLHRLFLWIIKKRKVLLFSCLALLVICLVGMSKVKVNNFLLEDLKKDNPIRQDFDYFEKEFAGVRPFEMTFTVLDSTASILDSESLRKLDLIDEYLRTEYEAGFVISPLNFIKTLNKASHNGSADHYRLPESDRQVKKLTRILQRGKNLKAMSAFIDKDLKECRISAKMGDWGKVEIEKRNHELSKFWSTEIGDELFAYRLTGTANLIDMNNEYLSRSMILGLAIAFLIVGLIVGLLYRSWPIMIIALIPNVLPLMMVAAVMGYTGIDLKVSTSIIFTIAFGIAVDDTIHFVSRLRLELAKGRNRLYALKRSFIGTGKAIIITSLILCAGFLTLILSTFKGTFYTGALLSMTLFFAVMADLIMLPILYWILFKDKKNASPSGSH